MIVNKIFSNKILQIIPVLCGIIFLSNFCHAETQKFDFNAANKRIELNDDGIIFDLDSSARSVQELLDQQKIAINSDDLIFPEKDSKIYSGENIVIQRAKKITIQENGKTTRVTTYQETIEQAIWENKNVELDEDDITSPARNLPVKDGMSIVVTHVLIKQETQDIDIPFKVTTNEDDSLGWRVKKVTQTGQKGIKHVTYKVVYNDGKEISRKILDSSVTKDPVDEIDTQGTFVKVGKASNGQASWYAFTGTLCAANPWLPLGSYAKVTNQDNGKTVIVKINDRGPFGKGRIIDLDKVAFSQIADLGAGIANVKMEPVLN